MVLLGWSSTVLGTSNHTRVFTAVVVHCGTITLQQHRPCFSEKRKKKKRQTQRAPHMPQFEYSSSSAHAKNRMIAGDGRSHLRPGQRLRTVAGGEWRHS